MAKKAFKTNYAQLRDKNKLLVAPKDVRGGVNNNHHILLKNKHFVIRKENPNNKRTQQVNDYGYLIDVINNEKKRQSLLRKYYYDMLRMPASFSTSAEAKMIIDMSKGINATSLNFFKTDSDAIRSDWLKIGRDMNEAIKKATVQFAK